MRCDGENSFELFAQYPNSSKVQVSSKLEIGEDSNERDGGSDVAWTFSPSSEGSLVKGKVA